MAKSKSEVIEDLKQIKNVPIAPLKDKPLENSSGDKYVALTQYNAMLDNITLGAHTTTTVEFAGIEWKMRLITSEEYADIRIASTALMKEKQLFDDWYSNYLLILKTLAKALSPTPFKTEGKAIFSEEDLKQIPFEVIEELYKRYMHFRELATKKVEDFTEEEIQLLIETVKKKPEALTEFGRSPLLIVSRYFLDYSARLEKMLKPEPTK
jgi:hypothetical protein